MQVDCLINQLDQVEQKGTQNSHNIKNIKDELEVEIQQAKSEMIRQLQQKDTDIRADMFEMKSKLGDYQLQFQKLQENINNLSEL